MSGEQEVEIPIVSIERETDSGRWVKVEEGFAAESFFLPNSMSDWAVDDSSVLIPEWLAIEKGLENYVD